MKFLWKYLFFVAVFWLLWFWAAGIGLKEMRINEIEQKIIDLEQKYDKEILLKEKVFKKHPRLKKYFK